MGLILCKRYQFSAQWLIAKLAKNEDRGMPSMKRFRHTLIFLICVIAMSACAARIGTRTTDGTYLNINGEAVNVYSGEYDDTVQAGIAALAAKKLTVHHTREGRNETVVLAGAPDGSPLRLHFVKEGRNLTVVKVRTGTIGFWDQGFSYQIQALINEQLKRKARPSPYTPADLKATSAGIKSEPIVARRTVSSLAPSYAFAASERPLATETGSSPSAQAASLPNSEVLTASGEPPSPPPLPEPDFTVYFDEDSNLPGPNEMAKLDQAVMQMIANPLSHIALSGFAGKNENDGQSQIVSESRLLAVKYYLIGKGVDADRIATAEHVLNLNEKADGVQRHRRVEIRFSPGP